MGTDIYMNCYSCGLKISRPYCTWYWQTDKPPRYYCFLCWIQLKPSFGFYIKKKSKCMLIFKKFFDWLISFGPFGWLYFIFHETKCNIKAEDFKWKERYKGMGSSSSDNIPDRDGNK